MTTPTKTQTLAERRAAAGHKIRPAIAAEGKSFYVYDEKRQKLFAIGLGYKHAKYVARKVANAGNTTAATYPMPEHDGPLCVRMAALEGFDPAGICFGGIIFSVAGPKQIPATGAPTTKTQVVAAMTAATVPVAPAADAGEVPLTGGIFGGDSLGLGIDQDEIEAIAETNADAPATTADLAAGAGAPAMGEPEASAWPGNANQLIGDLLDQAAAAGYTGLEEDDDDLPALEAELAASEAAIETSAKAPDGHPNRAARRAAAAALKNEAATSDHD